MSTSDKGMFVEDIINGVESGVGIFYLESKESSLTRGGKRFLKLVFLDRTGEIEGRLWDAEKAPDDLSEGDYVRVKFERDVYENRIQVRVLEIDRVEEVDEEWFVRSSEKGREELKKELFELIEMVEDKGLRKLLEAIFGDEFILDKFLSAPASKRIHHSYIGGLAEHTLNVTRALADISRHYPYINRDLLITASLLHDIGKIWEIGKEGIKNSYTYSGELLGHIYLGVSMVERYLLDMDEISEETKGALLHAILSHHGELEFGSPIEPKTAEAFMLHSIDNLDSKLAILWETKPDRPGSQWGYNKILRRRVLTGGKSSRED